jgi:hypothetical protein
MGPAKRATRNATSSERNERASNLHEICWLGEEDSNPRYVVQSHASYH